jgi:hypothetical protein
MKNKILYSVLFLIIGLSSCKKWQHQYPEDTERTKLTPTERLINKTWKLQKTTINGIDISDTVRSRIGDYTMEFSTRKENGLGTYIYLGGVTTTVEGDILTVWKFSDDESKIICDRHSSSEPDIDGFFYLYLNQYRHPDRLNGTSKILKLSEMEFKYQITNTNQDTIIINTFYKQ